MSWSGPNRRRRTAPPALVVAAVISLGAAPAEGPAPAPAAPTPETLLALAERGRQIALYLEAVAEAQETARAGGLTAAPDRIVVVAERDGWKVAFVKDVQEAPGKQALKLLAEAPFNPQVGEIGGIRMAVPPRNAPLTIGSHVRALGTAEAAAASRGGHPPWEATVFREKDGTFTVYLKSRNGEEPGTVRFGDDMQVRVASTGRQVTEIEPLHGEVVVVPGGARLPGQPTTLHTHVPGDLPSPTDVATVIRTPQLAPHLVLTPHWMFRIDTQGAITLLGPNMSPPVEKP